MEARREAAGWDWKQSVEERVEYEEKLSCSRLVCCWPLGSYSVMVGLCYSEEMQEEGQDVFEEALQLLNDDFPEDPKFTAIARVLCDPRASWTVRLQVRDGRLAAPLPLQ